MFSISEVVKILLFLLDCCSKINTGVFILCENFWEREVARESGPPALKLLFFENAAATFWKCVRSIIKELTFTVPKSDVIKP